ncbi:MAG: 3-hydroxylacyl-ACP dehydratase [Bacteroidales bacterium]|nr:3-hydroxylacyl-ACP dehydratase [Bacteroidales bacterium]
MLQGSFFHIKQITEKQDDEIQEPSVSSYNVTITLDAAHPIYSGHFPGNPVVPGVCQVRMITEIVSEITQKKMKLLEGDHIKFLSMINPNEHSVLTVDCTLKENEPGIIRVTASISDNEVVFFKCKSLLA